MVISGKPPVSPTCRWLSPGNHRFPRLADGYLRETTGFPDLSMVISGKPSVSPTYRWLSPGNHRFPRLINRYLRETTGFPDESTQARGTEVVNFFGGSLDAIDDEKFARPLADSSFNPSCSCIAVKIDGPAGSEAAAGLCTVPGGKSNNAFVTVFMIINREIGGLLLKGRENTQEIPNNSTGRERKAACHRDACDCVLRFWPRSGLS